MCIRDRDLSKADVVVVGAGVIGCAVGRELARRGASVRIIDDRPIAMGATQASAGVLAPYIEMRDSTPLLGPAVRSLDLFDEFVSSVSAETGATIPYRRTGTIDLALNDQEQAALALTASVISRLGVTAHLVDAQTARAQEPLANPAVIGGLLLATVSTLFFVPAFFSLLHGRRVRSKEARNQT